ncbi:mitoguardin 1 [Lampris incognitus]|uniref:mitoguardin 1 n=1 Tax=Lampris incognitus TaxID=2546036 RepID=UPI0024B4D51F|nr:mitoguardin 1 [Lampris incognitus]XP_056149029.1 mitoguardin 1 [Lampris incognitus]XP_056149030.1 mitoguardin 1 [Lampris incognitus]
MDTQATMTHEMLATSRQTVKMAALRVVDLPLSVYNSLTQVSLSTGTKKLVAATVFSAVSLLFLARRFQRRKGRRKARSPSWEQTGFEFPSPASAEKVTAREKNLTSLNSDNGYSCGPLLNKGLYRKLSGSLQSLGSVKSISSSSSCTCANESTCWDRLGDDDICNVVNIPVTTPENLYLMGMELFEEALRRWEQALTFRSRQSEEEMSCVSVKLGAGDAIAEEHMEEIIGTEFTQKLESLLRRAYRLQEEFEGVLGISETCSDGNSHHKMADMSAKDDPEDSYLRDSTSIASTDSFVSAAELSDQREIRSAHIHGSNSHHPFYEEALQMAEDGKISCRVLRTEMLECLGDTDFLAKLHCVRQACQLILCERATRMFLADTGKKVLSAIIVQAQKSPKRFEEVFEEMISFLEQTEHWENTELELATRGVKHLNFYDIVLDFILMDSFEDLENPPVSIQNVVNNRWLNSSFKETAVASSCWSVLKQKRQHMKVSDGFIAHFYAVCEQISPVLAWGFLGPKNSLHDFCRFFKDQVLDFLRDIFNPEKVRYSTVESLAEDMLHLLQRRSELLLSYLGTDSLHHLSGCVSPEVHLVPNALLEARVQ